MKEKLLHDVQFKNDLSVLLDYLWQDEKNHYEASPAKNHIYLRMKRLAKKVKVLE